MWYVMCENIWLSTDDPDPDARNLADLQVLVWDPERMPDDDQIDSFLIMTRSVRHADAAP